MSISRGHQATPQRGFPYRQIAREIVRRRTKGGRKVRLTVADQKLIAREILAGLRRAQTATPIMTMDLADAAFAVSTAIADEIERQILADLKARHKARK